jgi:ankyrin repeat protein
LTCVAQQSSSTQELIGLGVPVLASVEKGWTALHFAALHGNEVRHSA